MRTYKTIQEVRNELASIASNAGLMFKNTNIEYHINLLGKVLAELTFIKRHAGRLTSKFCNTTTSKIWNVAVCNGIIESEEFNRRANDILFVIHIEYREQENEFGFDLATPEQAKAQGYWLVDQKTEQSRQAAK